MSKSTLFIAVQCHQCSTMQVKQQKKSSNKWNCAVCNEKQSVRKVYAQGYQAKDIRHVVQSFNMARMFTDEQIYQGSSLGHFVEQLEGGHGTAKEEMKAVKRRSDWSEYVDTDEDRLEPAYLKSQLQEEQMIGQKVVTEFPQELMFKKPKLNGNFSSSLKEGKNRTYEPHVHKKSVTKDLMKTRARNEGKFNVDDGDCATDISSQHLQKSNGVGTKKTGASRWAEYMTEDKEFHAKENEAAFFDNSRITDAYKEQSAGADMLVEEDIHPDFM
ncbi:hypothetical protein vseg_003674 [Gypsophila vaccaria]